MAKLGQMGEVVSVKDGYARNFLLPQKKALRASKANIEAFEAQKAQLEAQQPRNQGKKPSAMADQTGRSEIHRDSLRLGRRLRSTVRSRPATPPTPRPRPGSRLTARQVVLIAPIKELGLHDVSIVLHPEVEATITLNVARSTEEAELQAAGKSIQELAAEEEAAAEFEIAELFDDIGAAQAEEFEEQRSEPVDTPEDNA